MLGRDWELEMQNDFLILGLGRATRPIVKFLLKKGKRVFGYDEIRDKGEDFLNYPNFTLVTQEDLLNLPSHLVVIASPGISRTHPLLSLGKEKGEVISDIEFVYRMLKGKGKIVGITGTNGKSTSCALLGKILTNAGMSAFWGGNIAPGKPAGSALFSPKEIFIFEVSSFQLERVKDFKPDIGILLNITKDHLDRYQSWQEYAETKMNLFRQQRKGDIAILNYDDFFLRKRGKDLESEIFWFSAKKKVLGTWFFQEKGYLTLQDQKEGFLFSLSDINLRGSFNRENVLAVSLAAYLLGVSEVKIREGIRSFKGLPHRLEFVRRISGVSFINNSMATNPMAFARSLSAFEHPVILIAGGVNKGLSLREYVEPMKRHSKFRIFIGKVKEELFNTLPPSLRRDTLLVSSLRSAVGVAREIAQKGDVVLFCPGFASFDMFRDFIHRGNFFKRVVREL